MLVWLAKPGRRVGTEKAQQVQDLQGFTKSGRPDSNWGPPAPKAGALTRLRYAPIGVHWVQIETTCATRQVMLTVRHGIGNGLHVVGQVGQQVPQPLELGMAGEVNHHAPPALTAGPDIDASSQCRSQFLF